MVHLVLGRMTYCSKVGDSHLVFEQLLEIKIKNALISHKLEPCVQFSNGKSYVTKRASSDYWTLNILDFEMCLVFKNWT